jgi:hypothetical protein
MITLLNANVSRNKYLKSVLMLFSVQFKSTNPQINVASCGENTEINISGNFRREKKILELQT